MLQQTLDKLEQMRLLGMVQALKEQAAQPEIASLTFECICPSKVEPND